MAARDVFVTKRLTTSIPPVISVAGILTFASLKIDYKTRQSATLKSTLGAFLLTRDAIDKGGTERSKRTMKDSGKAANLDGIDSRNVNNDSVLV